MKRISMATIILLLVVMTTLSFAATTPSISASSGKGDRGDDVEVVVSLNNNPGINYLSLSVQYDSKVLSLKSVFTKNLIGQCISSVKMDSNPFYLLWASAGDSTDDGMLVTFVFHVKEDAIYGDTTIKITVDECYNQNDDDVMVDVINSAVSIGNYHGSETSDNTSTTSNVVETTETNVTEEMITTEVTETLETDVTETTVSTSAIDDSETTIHSIETTDSTSTIDDSETTIHSIETTDSANQNKDSSVLKTVLIIIIVVLALAVAVVVAAVIIKKKNHK